MPRIGGNKAQVSSLAARCARLRNSNYGDNGDSSKITRIGITANQVSDLVVLRTLKRVAGLVLDRYE